MNRTLSGTLLILLSTLCYSFLPIFGKLAYQDGIGPLDLMAWRFIVASITIWVLYPLWRRRAQIGELTRWDVATLLAMGALYGVMALMGFVALERVPAGTYSLIFYTHPAMVAVISFALGERLPVGAWVAVGLALVGCSLVVGEQLAFGSAFDLALLLLMAGLNAVYLVIMERRTREISGLATGVFSIGGTFLMLLPLSMAMGGLGFPNQTGGWLAVLGIGVVSTATAILALMGAIARLGASKVAVLSTLEPVITVVLAAVLLGERIALLQYVGGGLILASVLLLNVSGSNSPQRREQRSQ